jgi:hypothetical protein
MQALSFDLSHDRILLIAMGNEVFGGAAESGSECSDSGLQSL